MTHERTRPPRSHGPELRVRGAALADVARITGMVAAAWPNCRPTRGRDVLECLNEYEVVETGDPIVAAVAIHDLGNGSAEIRSLVVDPAWRGLGLGRLLVVRAMTRARRLGLEPVCITRCPGFFESLGFERIALDSLPRKSGMDVPVRLARQRVAMAATAPEESCPAPNMQATP